MTDAIHELKTRAEILHKKILRGDPLSVARLRALPECRRFSDEQLAAKAPSLQRRDCLNTIAAELGFPNWHGAKAVLTGESEASPGEPPDFGTLLYRGGGHLNRWFARYDEAAEARRDGDGYLLAYKRQFFVVDRYFIESLGLDPADPDWREIGFDWVRPASMAARRRLYDKLIASLPREENR